MEKIVKIVRLVVVLALLLSTTYSYAAPLPPTGVSASKGTYSDKIYISWGASTGATYYRLYRAQSNSFSSAGPLSNWQTDRFFNDTSAVAGTTYYYWILAATSSTGSNPSGASASASGYRSTAPPTGVSASKGTYSDKIYISWGTSTGATYYRLYRAQSNSFSSAGPLSNWQTDRFFNDTSAVAGTTYYYWILAATSSTGSNPSGASASDSGYRSTAPPTGVSASKGTYSDKIYISWGTSTGATYYRLYRAQSNSFSSAGPLSNWQTDRFFNDTSAVAGTTYYYWILAATSSTGSNPSGASASDSGYRSTAPPTPPSDDHGNTCNTSTTVNINSNINGNIQTAGDIDFFKVQVPSAGTLIVYTAGTTDTYGYLKDSNCNTITSNDDSTDQNFRITQTVSAGTFYVAVKHYSSSGTGAYTLYVQFTSTPTPPTPPPDDHGNTCNTSTTVNLNSNINGKIEMAGDIDFFKVDVPSSGTLTVYTTGSTDTYGYLKNSSCSDLSSNDDATDANFRISQAVTAGTYFIAVRHYSSTGTGSYTLNINFITTPVTNPFAANFDTFIQNRNGNSIDMDGAYGAQCVDLMHAYIRDVLKVPYPHGFTGNAYPIYANAANSTTLVSTEFGNIRLDKIANTPTGVPQKGDIIFWGTGLVSTGHVAIFISGDVNSFTSIDQNWVNSSINGSPAAIVTHTYSNVVGWLHPVDIP